MRLRALVCLGSAVLLTAGCASQGHNLTSDATTPAVREPRLLQLDRTSNEALERGIASGKLAEGKVVYSVVLADNAAKFDSGRSSLSAETRQQLAELVNQLRADSKNIYLEIQGHTDSVGSAQRNRRLGLNRAEAVRLFLSRQGIALNRMATISYGEDAPVAGNDDPAGRAANRRVVIVVLS